MKEVEVLRKFTSLMSLKRPAIFPDVYKCQKRRKTAAISTNQLSDISVSDPEELEKDLDIPNDTKAGLLYLKSIFPLERFTGRIPAIILKHQLYSVIKDKTVVDRQLNEMWERNEVRLFKLTSGSDEFAVVHTDDYDAHVKSKMAKSNAMTIEKFLYDVLPSCTDVSISKKTVLERHKMTEDEISQLVNIGVLISRDVGSWWLTVPGVGAFMKNFSTGRKAIIQLLKKRKYGEILQRELESRKLKSCSKLGMVYHIHDIVGAQIVQCIDTTSGNLLRLNVNAASIRKKSRK